jgi:uncharacterized protein YjbI with pentapeptide repeats
MDAVRGGDERGRADSAIQPNALLMNRVGTSSTLDRVSLDHSIINNSTLEDSLLREVNFSGVSAFATTLDGSVFEQCSFRGVELKNCNVEGLVINGIRVGPLLDLVVAPDLIGPLPKEGK